MKKGKELQVVVKRVGEEPRIETWTIRWDQVSDKKEAEKNRARAGLGIFQECVGGSIEGIWVGGQVRLYCHGEGLLMGMPPNCCGFVGNIFFSKCDRHGWPQSLTSKECRKCIEWVRRYDQVPAPSSLGPTGIVVMNAQEIALHMKKQVALRRRQEQAWASL